MLLTSIWPWLKSFAIEYSGPLGTLIDSSAERRLKRGDDRQLLFAAPPQREPCVWAAYVPMPVRAAPIYLLRVVGPVMRHLLSLWQSFSRICLRPALWNHTSCKSRSLGFALCAPAQKIIPLCVLFRILNRHVWALFPLCCFSLIARDPASFHQQRYFLILCARPPPIGQIKIKKIAHSERPLAKIIEWRKTWSQPRKAACCQSYFPFHYTSRHFELVPCFSSSTESNNNLRSPYEAFLEHFQLMG